MNSLLPPIMVSGICVVVFQAVNLPEAYRVGLWVTFSRENNYFTSQLHRESQRREPQLGSHVIRVLLSPAGRRRYNRNWWHSLRKSYVFVLQTVNESKGVFHRSLVLWSFRGRKMSPVKTVYEPRFASQRGSSQIGEPQPDQTKDETGSLSQCTGGKRGNKRARGEKTRFILKVKLPIFSVGTLSKKKATKDKTPGRWMLEPTANTTKTQMSQGGGTQGNVAANVS